MFPGMVQQSAEWVRQRFSARIFKTINGGGHDAAIFGRSANKEGRRGLSTTKAELPPFFKRYSAPLAHEALNSGDRHPTSSTKTLVFKAGKSIPATRTGPW